MTYEQWVATETRHADFDVVENAFGYVPDGAAEVLAYSPGVIARLASGQYFTHVGRSEYAGSLADVQRALWNDYASTEVNDT